MNRTATKRVPQRRRRSKPTAVKRSPFEVILPDMQNISRAKAFFGLMFRASVAAVASVGMLMFVFDAFTVELPLWQPMVFSAIFTALFTLMSLGTLACVITLGVTALGLGVFALVMAKPVGYYAIIAANSVVHFVNAVMLRLSDVGYRTLDMLPYADIPTVANDPSSFGSDYVMIFCGMLAAVFCAVFVASTVRRTKMVVAFTFGGVIVAAIFTYNISSSSWGFAVIIAALCGMLALKLYDVCYNRARSPFEEFDESGSSQKSASKPTLAAQAMGGYGGILAMVLAFLLLIGPAATVKKNWILIDAINNRMAYARAVVSSVIIGDIPNLGDLGYLGNIDTLNARSTSATDRSFTGKEIMEVQVAYNTPVYLRSWVGTYYAENSWYSATTETVDDYHIRLFGESFTPEDITYEILTAVNPNYANLNNMSSYVGHMDLGYITMCVDVENLSSSGNLLFVPSMINSEVGLLEPGTKDKSDVYDGEHKNYYEGIVSSSWFNFDKNYRAVTLVPSYRNPDFDDTLDAMIEYYKIMTNYIFMYPSLTNQREIDEIVAFAESAADATGYEYYEPSIIARYYASNNAERADFINKHANIYRTYDSYVETFYLNVPDSEALQNAVAEVFSGTYNVKGGEYDTSYARPINSGLYSIYFDPDTGLPLETTHDKVMQVIDYLAESFTYSLTPKDPTRKNRPALDIFLDDTRQGYCVQFATAATMILRSIGIPARYVEGYIASEFIRNTDKDKLGNYVTTVHDYDAHAWVEVWVDGYGWMQYEVTPSYYDSMYKPLASTGSSVSRPDDYTYEEEELPEIELPTTPAVVEEEFDATALIVLGVVLAAFAVILAVALVIRRIAAFKKARRVDRQRVIDHAYSPTPSDDKVRLARTLGRYIMRLLALRDIRPESGELAFEFAERVDSRMADLLKPKKKKQGTLDMESLTSDDEIPTFDGVIRTIQRAEFGGDYASPSDGELREMAEFYTVHSSRIKKSMGFFEKLWFVRVRNLL